ncbi:hypothetical protein CB1_000726029 [Camelus ferus]|nr:hypothetical protein CB1_000726029 [Camelus ferus]
MWRGLQKHCKGTYVVGGPEAEGKDRSPPSGCPTAAVLLPKPACDPSRNRSQRMGPVSASPRSVQASEIDTRDTGAGLIHLLGRVRLRLPHLLNSELGSRGQGKPRGVAVIIRDLGQAPLPCGRACLSLGITSVIVQVK